MKKKPFASFLTFNTNRWLFSMPRHWRSFQQTHQHGEECRSVQWGPSTPQAEDTTLCWTIYMGYGYWKRLGLGTRLAMRYKICRCVSKRYICTSTSTQSPGRKTATVNYGIQVGVNHTYLRNNGLRKILASANIPPPSQKSLQKTSNIVIAKV